MTDHEDFLKEMLDKKRGTKAPVPPPTKEPEYDYRSPLFAVFFLGLAGIGWHMIKYNNDSNGYYLILFGAVCAGLIAIYKIRENNSKK